MYQYNRQYNLITLMQSDYIKITFARTFAKFSRTLSDVRQ